jgi:integrase
MPQLHLTDLSVRGLRGSDRYISYWDTTTPGFGIRVGKRSKTWMIMRGKSRERVTVGRYPDLSLSDARTKAKKLLAADGLPKTVRLTFKEAREEFLKEHYAGSTSEWPGIVKSIFNKHFKRLDGKQLTEVTDANIRGAIDQIEGPSAKVHAFRVARTFLNWSTKPPRRYLPHSPMAGYEAPGKDRKGSRILTDDELKAVWKAAETGSRPVFRLLILWGTRSKETSRLSRNWRLDEVLTIPGEHTKNGRDHAIPLLPLAQEVLGSRPELGEFFFPGRFSNDVPITRGSLAQLRRDIQEASGTEDWGAHDLRRTFRSNMARLGVPKHISEILLNHAPGVLDEIYDRYAYLDEKRVALAKYEEFMIKLLGRG